MEGHAVRQSQSLSNVLPGLTGEIGLVPFEVARQLFSLVSLISTTSVNQFSGSGFGVYIKLNPTV